MTEFKILFVLQMLLTVAFFIIGTAKAISTIMETMSRTKAIEKEKKSFLESLKRRQ